MGVFPFFFNKITDNLGLIKSFLWKASDFLEPCPTDTVNTIDAKKTLSHFLDLLGVAKALAVQ